MFLSRFFAAFVAKARLVFASKAETFRPFPRRVSGGVADRHEAHGLGCLNRGRHDEGRKQGKAESSHVRERIARRSAHSSPFGYREVRRSAASHPRRRGRWLTAQQVSDRCDDPFVAAKARDSLAAAAERGLVHVRRSPSDAPLEWKLSARGRRALRRIGCAASRWAWPGARRALGCARASPPPALALVGLLLFVPGASAAGLDLTHLRIGDGKITYSGAKRGYVFECSPRMGNSPGIPGPWISGNFWNFKTKPTVDGAVDWPTATYSVSRSGSQRTITGNGLPEHTQASTRSARATTPSSTTATPTASPPRP